MKKAKKMNQTSYHFPIVCSRSEKVQKLEITNNDERINVKTLTRMWNHFNSKASLLPSLMPFYNQIAKPLFEKLIEYKYSQITCQFLTQPNDEKGVTFIKNKDEYICLDISNRESALGQERVLLIELFVCCH